MSAECLLLELRAAGISLSPELDGRIRWRGTAGAMTPKRRAALRAHRDALLEILRREAGAVAHDHVAPAVAEAGSREPSEPAATHYRPVEAVSEADPVVELLGLAERAGFSRIVLHAWGPIGPTAEKWRDFARRLDSDAAWIAHATETLRVVVAGKPVPRRWLGPPVIQAEEELMHDAIAKKGLRVAQLLERAGRP
jgi:hypothetical protein